MRYFTPERWLELQHVEDEKAFYSAQTNWEQAHSEYCKQLARLLPRLPRSLQRFAKEERLHDATVLADWRGRSRLTLLLHPDQPGSRLFLLNYTLVEPPSIIPTRLPKEYQTEHLLWKYDEIGAEKGGRLRGEPVFTHCILLSDGREIRLRFTRFTFSQRDPVLPLAGARTVAVRFPLSHSA
jgi:hypothetical protein